MCFENLPIVFDSSGNAHLIPGVPNPYEFKIKTPEEKEEQLKYLLMEIHKLSQLQQIGQQQ